jgi:hypothetical protein
MLNSKLWDEKISTEETNEILTVLARSHFEAISPDFADRELIIRFLTDGDFSSLCSYDVPYGSISANDAIHLRQGLAFFQKRADLDLGVNRELVAFKKFEEAEELCQETNKLFRLWGAGLFQFTPEVEVALSVARNLIADVLGDVPTLDSLDFHFGPGATFDVAKRVASPRAKLSSKFACSTEMLPFVGEFLAEFPQWVDFRYPFDGEGRSTVPVELQPGRLAFVPKTAKVDRAIVVEPLLNTMYQNGVGKFIAQRLKLRGVDIRDQTRNQSLARVGSITGDLATLDLSSASDTIAIELVYHLLPVDWALFLNQGRTGTILYNDQCRRLHKFSSMGNGFTFPLETLIFWALAKACAPHSKSVNAYGDDIIVPSKAYPYLCRVLHACGFLVNTSKSFADGPFRESCGADYFNGINIRPLYIKEALSLMNVFIAHNFYKRAFDEERSSYLLGLIPKHFHVFGPDGYGDGHLIGDYPVVRHRRDDGWAGYIFETFTLKGRKSYRPYEGDYVYPLYCVYIRGDGVSQSSTPLHGTYSNKSGSLWNVVPGHKGYKRIKIYTLLTP